MKILYITPRYAPAFGGMERHVEALATRIRAQGHDVHVVTQSTRPPYGPATVAGVPVYRTRAINRSEAYGIPPGLFAYVARRSGGYDVIHAHGYHGVPALASLLGRRTPTVFTPHYHGDGHTVFARLMHVSYRPLGHGVFRHARAVICVSDSERTLVERDVPAVADRISVIPNGVDLNEIRAAAPATDPGPYILAGGRLEAYKRLDLLVRATAALPSEWRLIVTGDGPERSHLQELGAGLLGDRLVLAGRVADDRLRSLLRGAAIVASVSLHEAYGMFLVEGLAAGAAVIASDIPAHREVVEDRAAATLLPVSADPAAIAAAILARAAGGRPDAAPPSMLDWDEVSTRTAALYESVLDRGARA
jgi:glycosyltransferase involved in cell wall biosynthesis